MAEVEQEYYDYILTDEEIENQTGLVAQCYSWIF